MEGIATRKPETKQKRPEISPRPDPSDCKMFFINLGFSSHIDNTTQWYLLNTRRPKLSSGLKAWSFKI